MPYADLTGMYNRFSQERVDQLLDRDGDGQPDAGVFDAALADAQAEMDIILAQRYAVPLADPAPLVITTLACAIILYQLYRDDPPKLVAKRHAAALLTLEQFASGAASIPGLKPAPSSSIAVEEGPREFADTKLSEFHGDD